jgi:hypothetical protein
MSFLRRHQYLLCFLGVLVLSSVMVLRQFVANQSAHAELREDFILLHDRGETKACEALYQELIQGLAGLNEQSLVEDLQRTSLLIDPKSPDQANPVWRYYASVRNELQKRSEQRLARALKRAGNP